MKQQASISYDDSLFAVAERGSDRLRVLLARKGSRPTAVDCREFALTDATSLTQWLDLKRCNDLRMLLPASAVIVRSTTLPAASQTQMLTALALQAESFFLGSVPHHRLGLAVLNEGSSTERRGLIVAWPTNQPATETPARLESITTYLPEPAALMVLASSDLPAIVADRRNGSIAIALRSPTGIVLRSAREDAMADAWNEGLRRAIAETALNAGIEPSRIAAVVASAESAAEVDGDRIVVLDPDVRGALNGKIAVDVGSQSLESSWWRNWATLLGAAVAASGPLAELCRLRKHEKGSEPTPIARFVQRYSDPVRAFKVVVAAVAIMAVAPMALAWVRAKVYEWKMPSSLGEFQMQQFDVEQRISHYEALGRKALPATKLLGDLAVATPDGIELESIQLSLSQGVSVRGIAKPQNGKSPDEIVNTMASLMDSSGVFRKTSWNWTTPDGRNVFKFNLSAQIARPTLITEVPELRDWAVKSLAKRKYPDPNEGKAATSGDGAAGGSATAATTSNGGDAEASAGTTPPATTVASADGKPTTEAPAAATNGGAGADASASSATNSTTNGETNGETNGATGSATVPERGIGRRPTPNPNDPPKAPVSGGAGTGAGGGPGSVAKANLTVPDTFTDAQLKAMTTAELREKLTVFAQARRREDLDPETTARVRTDFQRIVDALKEAQTK